MFTGVNLFCMSILLRDRVPARLLAFTFVNAQAPLGVPGVNMLTLKPFSHCRNTAAGGPFAKNHEQDFP